MRFGQETICVIENTKPKHRQATKHNRLRPLVTHAQAVKALVGAIGQCCSIIENIHLQTDLCEVEPAKRRHTDVAQPFKFGFGLTESPHGLVVVACHEFQVSQTVTGACCRQVHAPTLVDIFGKSVTLTGIGELMKIAVNIRSVV